MHVCVHACMCVCVCVCVCVCACVHTCMCVCNAMTFYCIVQFLSFTQDRKHSQYIMKVDTISQQMCKQLSGLNIYKIWMPMLTIIIA